MNCVLIETSSDTEFVERAVTQLLERITQAINNHGACVIGLSGGSTPQPIYQALANVRSIDWSKIFLFLVDERYVPVSDDQSNQKLIRETLLTKVTLQKQQIVFPNTALPIATCVEEYDRALKKLFAEHPADIVILGMGDDGHIASLFPPLSDEAFGDRYVVHTKTTRFAVPDRISVTMPVLSGALAPFLFLRGKEKKQAWTELQQSTEDERRWPAKAVFKSGKGIVVARW